MTALDKSISSLPEASRFRSTVVIILVLLCVAAFLHYSRQLSARAEEIARQQVVNQIRQSLAMLVYDYAIKSQQEHLPGFDQHNPFIPLAMYSSLPTNYHGEVERVVQSHDLPGWYFERRSRKAIYLSMRGEVFGLRMRYQEDAGKGGFLFLREEGARLNGVI